jgi:hypothetical protein
LATALGVPLNSALAFAGPLSGFGGEAHHVDDALARREPRPNLGQHRAAVARIGVVGCAAPGRTRRRSYRSRVWARLLTIQNICACSSKGDGRHIFRRLRPELDGDAL